MAKITSIDDIDRLALRDVETATAEMRDCRTEFEEFLRYMAQQYPGAIAFGTVICGEAKGLLVLSASCEEWIGTYTAPQRARTLGRIFANLPTSLRDEFVRAFDAEVADIAAEEEEETEPITRKEQHDE